MEQFKPTDATTNPSLILAAANQKKYSHLIEKAVQYGKKVGTYVLEKFFLSLREYRKLIFVVRSNLIVGAQNYQYLLDRFIDK